ncbi:uncharacterized protein LOC117181699 [Belonocnema kinseyi]|uniref:uncharacterized protein LOC117181699 n=1 Tax=Belonocnema kinseyi TaxID=2817044 RepID=UPI00143E093F|nr:uncharacterized protein LOC117181699 [Belonocnema kinseyi]
MSFFVNECFICEATDSVTPCNRCFMILYCGPDHQKEDWPMHKEFCDAIWSVMREKKVAHIYESLSGVDLDTWIKERKKMCWAVKSKLRRDLLLQEEQMLLMPRSCFVCHDTRQDFLTTCTSCFCANFCAKHPSSSEHEKDCHSLKLFREFDGKMQDPAKLRTIFTLIENISDTARFEDSSEVPHSMKEFLDQQIKGEDYRLEQACASNILSMSLTLFNAMKKLNLQSASEILLHIRCDVTDSDIWELLLHFLPNLKVLNIVFIEQRESQKLTAKLCDDCVSKKKRIIIETNELVYKNYLKVRIYKKPDIFAYLNAEISKNDDVNVEWKFLLENLSRIGVPVVLTSVTETMAKVLAKSLKSTFWPSLICYEGPNDFGALEPLREWSDGGVSRINQRLIITKGRTTLCKAGFFQNCSWLTKKRREDSRSPLVYFYPNVCIVCRSQDISTFCKFCNMIFYCSEPHRKEDWSKHKETCQAIQRLLKQSGMKSIFDGEIDLMGSKKTDPESWLRAKLNIISKAESQLGKKLWIYQQQMFLFPKTCFVCHEGEFSKLKGCECGIHLCKRHNDSPHHKEICDDFQLSLQLFEKEKLPNPLPKYKYVPGVKENLPGSIEEFIDLHLELESEDAVDKNLNYNRVVIGELLTKPLTLLYAIQKLMIPKFRNERDIENNSTLVVHVIGSKNAANVYYEFWGVFFNWMENLKTLNISFVGPETTNLNLNRTFPEVKEKNLSIKSYPLDYEQFVQSSIFVKPDIVVGYNLDIHECEIEKCSCRENILTIRKLNVPFVMTSGSKERAEKDHERVSKLLESSVVYDFCDLNPFVSLVPERDFETEGLRFSNKYLLMYCNFDQPDVQNSKLRKYLLESLEAKRLADDSHLSDLEKALRAIKIESPLISSIETAESEGKAPISRNNYLFDAAKDELRYMMRKMRRPKSVGCKNSGLRTDLGAKDDKLSTGESESKSEPNYAKNKISEENLLFNNLDSEQKSESEPAVEETFEKNVLTATEDSESKSESGSATLHLFKENVFPKSQYSECTPELGTKNIWNELFGDNILSIEDSVSELESGYAKVEIAKNLKSTPEQDFESKSEFENKNLLPTTENHVFKLELESIMEIKNFVFIDDYSQPESESESTKDLVEQDLLLKLTTIEDSANLLSTEDSESKLKSESINDEILREDLFATIENSESNLESEFMKEILKEKSLLSAEDAEHKSESESINLKKSGDSFTILNSEFKPASEFGNLEISKNFLPNAEDTEDKSESGSVEDLVIQTLLLKLSTAEGLEYNSETGSSKEIEESKPKSESINLHISEEDPLSTIETSEFKLETGPPMDESHKEDVLNTANLQSESRSADTTIDLEEYLLSLTEDPASKSESGSAKVEIVSVSISENSVAKTDFDHNEGLESKSEIRSADTTIDLEQYLSSLTEDLASKSESGSANISNSEDPTSKSESANIETVSTSNDIPSKSKSNNVEMDLISENFAAKSESKYDKDIEFKSESASTTGETFKEHLLTSTEDSVSESGSLDDDSLKKNLLSSPEDPESKTKSDFANVVILTGDLLSMIEDSESRESGFIHGETLKNDLLPNTEESEKSGSANNILFKSESGSLTEEILKVNSLSTENFESVADSVSVSKSKSGDEKDEIFVKSVLLIPEQDLESKSESGTVNGNILKDDFESKESGFTYGETLKNDLLPNTEESEKSGSANNIVFKSESGSLTEEILKVNSLSTENFESVADSVSVSKSKSGDEKDEIFVKSVLLIPEQDLESEPGTANGNILKDDFESKESGFADDEILKEDLLSTSKDSESKESGFADDKILKEDLFSTSKNSESKSENVPHKDKLFQENLLPAEDFESDSGLANNTLENSSSKLEPGPANVQTAFISENTEAQSKSGSTNGETLKEDLLSTTENSEPKSESGSVDDFLMKDVLFLRDNENFLSKIKNSESKSDNVKTLEDLLSSSEDFQSKPESGSLIDTILKDDIFLLTEDSICKSEFEFEIALGENLLTTEETETKSVSSSVNFETWMDDLLSTGEFESKLESESLEENLLLTKNSESKAEFDSVKDDISRKNLLPLEELDFESKSESESVNSEALKNNFMPPIANSECKSECDSSKDELFKENLLPMTEDFESTSECGAADEKLKDDLLPISGDSENFKLKSESESTKENEDSESLSKPGSAILESFEDMFPKVEDPESETELESAKDKIFKEILLPATEDFQSKSEPGTDEKKLIEDLLSKTGDSECDSESGPTKKELFMENLLLKEEIIRLKANEELVKSENSRLKEELCRLRKVSN